MAPGNPPRPWDKEASTLGMWRARGLMGGSQVAKTFCTPSLKMVVMSFLFFKESTTRE